jgi:hypothetical protein
MKVNAAVQLEGARVFLIDECFDLEFLTQVNQLFADSTQGWADDPVFAHTPGRLVYHASNSTTQSIDQYAVTLAAQVGQLLGRPVEYRNSTLWLDQPGYTIAPHYDQQGNPEIAVQIYVGTAVKTWEMLGTCVYRDNNRPLFEMHYRPNSGYLMEYPHLIRHGLNHNIPQQYRRNSVYLRYAYK